MKHVKQVQNTQIHQVRTSLPACLNFRTREKEHVKHNYCFWMIRHRRNLQQKEDSGWNRKVMTLFNRSHWTPISAIECCAQEPLTWLFAQLMITVQHWIHVIRVSALKYADCVNWFGLEFLDTLLAYQWIHMDSQCTSCHRQVWLLVCRAKMNSFHYFPWTSAVTTYQVQVESTCQPACITFKTISENTSCHTKSKSFMVTHTCFRGFAGVEISNHDQSM